MISWSRVLFQAGKHSAVCDADILFLDYLEMFRTRYRRGSGERCFSDLLLSEDERGLWSCFASGRLLGWLGSKGEEILIQDNKLHKDVLPEAAVVQLGSSKMGRKVGEKYFQKKKKEKDQNKKET